MMLVKIASFLWCIGNAFSQTTLDSSKNFRKEISKKPSHSESGVKEDVSGENPQEEAVQSKSKNAIPAAVKSEAAEQESKEVSHTNSGSSSDADPQLVSWVERFFLDEGNKSYPFVAFYKVGKPGEMPQFLPFDFNAFNKSSYVKSRRFEELDWNLKLNRRFFNGKNGLDFVSTISRADLIVNTSDPKKWQILGFGKNKRSVLAESAPPNELKEDVLAEWLTANLGWDGVLLEKKDDTVLVWTGTGRLSKDLVQAMAVKNSDGKLYLQPTERKGSGLLSLIYSKNGVGIFKILFQGKATDNLPNGTKLIIQKE